MDASYKKDLEIDKFALEEEWERQPHLFMKWAEREADAIEQKDRAERRLSVVKAEMDAKVRTNPGNYNIERVSEGAITLVVVNSKEYRLAEDALIEAKKGAKLISSAVAAFDHKKRALTKLTDLWVAGYYGGQGVPKSIKDQAIVKTREKQVAGLNRRKLQD